MRTTGQGRDQMWSKRRSHRHRPLSTEFFLMCLYGMNIVIWFTLISYYVFRVLSRHCYLHSNF